MSADLKPRHHKVLAALPAGDPAQVGMRPAEVAAMLGLRADNVSRAMFDLVEAGLVRFEGADGHRRYVRLEGAATSAPSPETVWGADDYEAFLARKAVVALPAGIPDPGAMPDWLKAFQADITLWALRLGRAAVFAGTGLGKTRIQLAWAAAVHRHTGRPVLILTPLAVSHQTVAEAVDVGLTGVAYAANQGEIATPIVITNYDRIDHFDLSLFAGVALDESSIIKAHDSKTRRVLTERCRVIPFRLCCTATPAPNDYVELGQHAEFLGVMTAKEMLATWFVHDGSIRATNVDNHGGKPVADWRLKRHAERDFWRWLSTWAVLIRRPSDLGHSDTGYILPALHKHQITVRITQAPCVATGTLFRTNARTLKERLDARRDTIAERVQAAAEIVNAQPDRPWLVWGNLNAETEALVKAIPDAVEVRGPDHPDKKRDRLLGFVTGSPRVLVSKPSIAGFGMNWQHCSDMVFVGLNDSFEQLYQAIRRCWRFGQIKPVNVYLIASDLEGAVVANLEAKEAAADAMAEAMAEHMRDLFRRANGQQPAITPASSKPMEIPRWLKAS
nr:MarR family transcriptional regulator [uncultured Azospirillum sp.]